MSMPRYKYAIGNAPVRFPSLPDKRVEDANPGQATNANDSASTLPSVLPPRDPPPSDPVRPSRWSMLFGTGEDPSGKGKGNDKTLKKARSHVALRSEIEASAMTGSVSSTDLTRHGEQSLERQRSTSMRTAGDRMPGMAGLHPDDPRPTRSSIFSSRAPKHASWNLMPDDSSRATSRTTSICSGHEGAAGTVSAQHERSPLLGGRREEMAQRDAKPAVRPFSTASLRPTSLFWTEVPASSKGKDRSASPASDPKRTAASSHSTVRGPRSYGAVEEPVADTVDEDDPYGYRALAGPALLPTFHQQQQSKRAAAEAQNSRLGFLYQGLCSGCRLLSLVALASMAVGVYVLFFR